MSAPRFRPLARSALGAGLLAAACALGALAPGPAAAVGPLTVGLFARVPSPGQPEGLAVAPDGRVYVGTDTAPLYSRPDGTPNSKVFAYSPTGALERAYTVPDARAGSNYGLFGLVLDAAGVIYAIEHNPASVIAIDPVTGAQRVYTSFRRVPRCVPVIQTSDCKDTVGDLDTFPNFAVFAPDGYMYVTDTDQALIWRVPRGGGRPRVWLTDPGLESVFGPNDAALTADARTLLFVISTPAFNGQRLPGLYAVPVRADGSPGPLRQLWQAQGSDFPEGIAIGRSGDLYVSAAGNNQIVVLSPQGRELARVPMSSQENNAQPVPFDEPATVAFDGTHLLTPNHAYTSYNPAHWAVLSVDAGEPGIGDFHPVISSFAPSPGGGSPPSSPGAGRRGCGRGRVVVRLPRARRRRYTRVRAFVDGRLATARRGRRLRAVVLVVPSGAARAVRVKVVARTRAGRAVTVRRLYRACAGSGTRLTARGRRRAP